MKIFKSHFRYNKRQRNGIFFLLLLIVLLQTVLVLVDFSTNKNEVLDDKGFLSLEKQLDSLNTVVKLPKNILNVNPNFLTSELGYSLGLNLNEIDRILKFRKTGKWMNTIQDFKQVSGVSDSLFEVIRRRLKFPVRKSRKSVKAYSTSHKNLNEIIEKKDINKAGIEDFKSISGVGDVLSARIVKYRKRLQGFSESSQLKEVWGLKPEVVENILNKFSIQEKTEIVKLNINTASFKEVLSIVYIDYETTKLIFNYRKEVHQIEDLLELKKIAGFPIDKYDRIALYLQAE
ncbi:helix-hairpin-helix domain-containing protein [Bacteroidota bacterium]